MCTAHRPIVLVMVKGVVVGGVPVLMVVMAVVAALVVALMVAVLVVVVMVVGVAVAVMVVIVVVVMVVVGVAVGLCLQGVRVADEHKSTHHLQAACYNHHALCTLGQRPTQHGQGNMRQTHQMCKQCHLRPSAGPRGCCEGLAACTFHGAV